VRPAGSAGGFFERDKNQEQFEKLGKIAKPKSNNSPVDRKP
jgi:hypothetical protein